VSGTRTIGRSARSVEEFRNALAVLGFIIWFLALVPPLGLWARKYEFVQAIQFGSFALITPALLVTGAPWRRLGLASREPFVLDADGAVISPTRPRLMDRIALSRRARGGHVRPITAVVLYVIVVVLWRWAPVVDALIRHPWLVGAESASLVLVGVLVLLELVESPPLSPSLSRPFRIGVAAPSMWAVWVVAYFNAMSHDSWYRAFHHVAGQGISAAADQQLTSAVMWMMAGATFIPVVFWNLVHWLQAEEDPDVEMYRLVREERTRGNSDSNL
jgi:cytochrome c oxidase assembly factor CtaG